jgi:UDP-glucose 4-epimerase
MKILVTGGKGFIGSHLIPALWKKGHSIWSYDYQDKQDILDIPTLAKYIKWADVVYHLAALTDVQDSFEHQEEYYMVNCDGTMNVVNACKEGKKKLIYTSTAASYNPTSSPYAHSKQLAERYVYGYQQATIFRLFNIYGDGMNKTTMISRFQQENPIIIYGEGLQTRDFIHIDDVVNILVSALGKKWEGFVGDVGTGKERTVLSVAKLFKKPIQFKAKRNEVYHSKANIKLLRKLYKKPFIPFHI